MSAAVQCWRARIGGADGAALGAGLLVDRTRLVTCAHVVQGRPEVSVTLPGLADTLPALAGGLPATVTWRGDWRRPGDPGDIAVVELAQPLPSAVAPCVFAPADALWPVAGDARAATRELRALGFPDGHEAQGAYVTLRTSGDRTLGPEWQEIEVEQAHLRRLDEGFSGAAVYDPGTGHVVGMVTDAVLHGDHAGYIGRMMPLRTIRRHWEGLDDLLDLDWLARDARCALRALLEGVKPGVGLEHVVRAAFPTFRRPLPPFPSTWAAVRYVGEYVSGHDRLLRLLTALVPHLPDGTATAVEDWMRGRLDGYEPGTTRHGRPRQPRAGQSGTVRTGSVIVRLDPVTRGARLELTVITAVDGTAVAGTATERIRRDQVRAKVEAVLAAQARLLHDCDWMLEFVVPQGLMHLPYEEWELREPGASRPRPLRTVPVVVRHVERLKPLTVTHLTRERWRTVRARGETRPVPVACALGFGYEEFYGWFDAEEDLCALAYATHPAEDGLAAALDTGVPIMLWRRSACCEGRTGVCTSDTFLERLTTAVGTSHPDRLPVEVMRLRKEAHSPYTGDADHCGRRLTLFWDDPARIPDPPLAMGVPGA
ncbi:trypsin-like peptidase domain-containing protein [Streptomyces typhae]|uniref:VMAP-C domain-containing protein n=1 Tax=Streptomyces typhae TaxID=2681492 RepID=UPI0012F6D280